MLARSILALNEASAELRIHIGRLVGPGPDWEKLKKYGLFRGFRGGHFGSFQGDDGMEWKIIRGKE